MAFWTLEQLLEDNRLVPDHLARKFAQHQIFGIGSTVKAFLRSYKDQGLPWEQAGQPSAGNGALMRMAPVFIPHLRQPSPAPSRRNWLSSGIWPQFRRQSAK